MREEWRPVPADTRAYQGFVNNDTALKQAIVMISPVGMAWDARHFAEVCQPHSLRIPANIFEGTVCPILTSRPRKTRFFCTTIVNTFILKECCGFLHAPKSSRRKLHYAQIWSYRRQLKLSHPAFPAGMLPSLNGYGGVIGRRRAK